MSQLQISYNPIDGANANIETQNGNNKVNTGEGVVRTDVLKTGTELKTDFYSINRAITESEQPLVRLEMDKALDVLNAIEMVCDEGTKTQLNLDQKTQHVGTVKNLFYKFLGLFSKSLENSKRTQALNAKLHSVATRLKDDKDLYNGVLLSTLNDPELNASLKTTCFKLYDGDPDTQDKLFKSLKEPPKEIREQFWERHGEKILNGDFFGFKLKDADFEAVRNEFMSVKTEPLKSLFIKNISAEECKNLNEYREVFEKSNLPNTFAQKGHVETFLMSYFSVTEEHAKTLLQDDIEAGKVENLKEQHRQNADKIFGILSKSNSITFGDNGILLFRELFQGGDGKRFTFTVNGQTVCDIDQSKLKELAKQKEPAERLHLAEILKLANNDLKHTIMLPKEVKKKM